MKRLIVSVVVSLFAVSSFAGGGGGFKGKTARASNHPGESCVVGTSVEPSGGNSGTGAGAVAVKSSCGSGVGAAAAAAGVAAAAAIGVAVAAGGGGGNGSGGTGGTN
jgi:hypothetical protein